ncbi:MAG: GspE/PulE family protein [Candidatus Babeliales bacterium]|jgi:type II secretory ATPase GspE/PulE/Tfp pilus assembly ATPase PilB-like protein
MDDGTQNTSSTYSLFNTEEKIIKSMNSDPVIDYVDQILCNAIAMHASDIHLQPEEMGARARYRIDGTLYDQDSINPEMLKLVISRIKIIAGLDIAIQRIPQDGKIKLNVSGKHNQNQVIDLRISTFPSTYGEKMVIRILDRSHNLLNLESLGMNSKMFTHIQSLIKKPHGFFLVTGPTGSGKTTTLYAILSALNKPGRNIVTMEDPVEYAVPGITQSQVNDKAGFSFQNGLRCMLRQDPDIIMIGEIRDKITAQIAIEASLTGHLVFSTLHTNDAAGAITRLIDMRVEPFLINATLTGILAQRLARKLCSKCKKEAPIKNPDLKNIKTNFEAPGCSDCFNLGHKGRLGIFELLVLDDQIRDLVLQKAATTHVVQQALKTGMQTLMLDGFEKVNSGQISLEELYATVTV